MADPNNNKLKEPVITTDDTQILPREKSESGETGAPTRGHGFGTAPVFLAAISTILGAIMFLRFGYAVAHTGLAGSLLIILIGHMVTIPTALAIAEIATNRRVEGGGEYFIISRSFGTTIGATIGIALYLSQAISVAFYMIAFAEAFQPLAPLFEQFTGLAFDPRVVSLPATFLLSLIILKRGASLGVNALWVVVTILFLAILSFFAGNPLVKNSEHFDLLARVPNPDPFFVVFAIVFPAFTGMTAGVGLSGDLRNPRRSIPLGTISASLTGMIVYIAIVIKLALSATPEQLASDQLIMAKIALWGPLIPVGLACATLSSAIGSILVAPRTLQALGTDQAFPIPALNEFIARGIPPTNEPKNATLITSIIAIIMVSLGNVDMVARIISMFFMVTYGSICAISFLEHLAANPSFRPSFRSRWYISLLGALMCLFMMFQMDPLSALLAILIMTLIYRYIRKIHGGKDDLASLFQGVMSQATRYMQIRLQKARARGLKESEWRPSIIAVNPRTFERLAHIRLMQWLCYRYGFGTYLHYIQGQLNAMTYQESRRLLARMLGTLQTGNTGIYFGTMVSPSMRSALAQTLQVPGVFGMENNTILFEFSIHDPKEVLQEIYEGCLFASFTRMNTLVLRHGDYHFGNHQNIHIWLTWHDYHNASLMILLSYILLGHPEWKNAEIYIYAAFPFDQVAVQKERLQSMILEGRIPVSEKNIRIIPTDDRVNFNQLVQRLSHTADLVILGFTEQRLKEKGVDLFKRHPGLRDVLFVNAQQAIRITEKEEN